MKQRAIFYWKIYTIHSFRIALKYFEYIFITFSVADHYHSLLTGSVNIDFGYKSNFEVFFAIKEYV